VNTQLHRVDGLRSLLTAALSHAGPEALGKLILASDSQIARISDVERGLLVARALADGDALARETVARWGSDPEVVARHLGIPVITSREPSGFGSVVVYAEYGGNPPRIVLYETPLANIEARIRSERIGELLGCTHCRPIFLAHELYHHLDLARGGDSIARRERVTVLCLGRFSWTSGIVAVAEIAAGAFAQRLVGLRFHPKLLDLVTIYDADRGAARRMVRALVAPPLVGER
jgi:hypothetical protein